MIQSWILNIGYKSGQNQKGSLDFVPSAFRVASYATMQDQVPYDAVADVKPALDRLQVEIDIQDFRVVQVSTSFVALSFVAASWMRE